jgi:hypothetical protein
MNNILNNVAKVLIAGMICYLAYFIYEINKHGHSMDFEKIM